jgi:large subunit ribosomal protein L5e
LGFIKIVKNNSYYSRFQVKFKRRRQGKTDYYARRRLTHQDKNKYDTKKYRFVVRRTNTKIICQIIYATIQGDRVLCQALSPELKKFGLSAGLTNYASAYATGLLCARRLLKQLDMEGDFKGIEAPTGELYDVYKVGYERRPFKANLDVGLVRTTTGNRVFGAMKGAVDGGLYIPHNTKRFPGSHVKKAAIVTSKRGKANKDVEVDDGEKMTFSAEEHRNHIFGIHVQGYMDHLIKTDKPKYAKQFSKWEKCLKDAKTKTVEALYKKVHSEIRKNPAFDKKKRAKAGVRKEVSKKDGIHVIQNSKGKKWMRRFHLTNEERKARVQAKIVAAMNKMA